jgi:hypothetical protein
MYRPSPMRVGGFAAFGLLGLIPVMADGVAFIGRAAGWMMLALATLAIGLSLRTWVTISNRVVEVGRVRGKKRFAAGEASARQFAVPGGLVRDRSAIRIEGVDGDSVTIALSAFRSRDQVEMVRRIRGTLNETMPRESL